MGNFSLQHIINRISLLKHRYFVSFPSDYVPTLDNDTFAIINTQVCNIQGEIGIMFAQCRNEMCLADSLARRKYHFFKKQYIQLMPEPLQSHSSVCGFYTFYAAVNLIKFQG